MPDKDEFDPVQMGRIDTSPSDAEQIDMRQLTRIADDAAASLWDVPACRGAHFPVYDSAGDLFAYGFRYGAGLTRFPEHTDYLQTLRAARDGRQPAGETTACVFSRYGCVYVSASRRDFPLLAIQKSPPSIDTIGDIALRKAQDYFDAEDVSFERFHFLGPHFEYLSFRHGEAEILVSGCGFHPYEVEDILTPGAARAHPPEIARRIDAAWARALSLEAIPQEDLAVHHSKTEIVHKALVPKINYSYWCVPTSFAMILSFYDNLVNGQTILGYGKIVDHWKRHPNDAAHHLFGENVPNIIDEYMDPTIGSWRKGGSFTDHLKTASGVEFHHKKSEGDASNDYGWDILKNEIDHGRPCLWSIRRKGLNHDLAAIGYETKNGQKFVVVYDPPNDTTPTYETTYAHDQWQFDAGATNWVTEIYPKTTGKPDHLALVAPDGGETFTVSSATKVSWFVWGTGITKTKLLLSTDHGRSWTTLAQGLAAKTGWNSYDWLPTKTSTAARLKVEGYDAANALVAADGSFEDFTIKADAQNRWSDWSDLGNPLPAHGSAGDGVLSIAAAENADGRAELFAGTTDGHVWHRYQKAPNGTAWANWSDLGQPPGVSLYLVEASANSDGRLELFAIGSDGAVWHSWQPAPSAGPWSGWASRGSGAGVSFLRVRACANQDGRIEIFALGSDGAIWHAFQDKPAAGPWSGWKSLGRPSGIHLRTFDARLTAPGTIALCASGGSLGEGEFQIAKSAVWQARQPEPNHRSAWQGWTSLGTPCDPGTHLNVTLGRNKDGRLDLFTTGQGRLWRRSHAAPSGQSWTNWSGMDRPAADTALLAPLAAAMTGDGRQEVFSIAARGTGPGTVLRVWHRFQTAPSGIWAGWAGLAAPQGRSPETLCTANQASGRVVLFAVTSEDRSVWMIAQR